jgi:hypothetical protein
MVQWYWHWNSDVLRGKPTPASFYPPRISILGTKPGLHDRSRRLIACNTLRHLYRVGVAFHISAYNQWHCAWLPSLPADKCGCMPHFRQTSVGACLTPGRQVWVHASNQAQALPSTSCTKHYKTLEGPKWLRLITLQRRFGAVSSLLSIRGGGGPDFTYRSEDPEWCVKFLPGQRAVFRLYTGRP